MFAYLAHPIDQAGQNSWLGSMLADLEQLMVGAGVGTFRPGSAYLADTGNNRHTQYINDLNNVAIHQADFLVAVLPADLPTLGTPVEIGLALHMRKPVLIFTDISNSVQLAAWAARGAVVIDMSDPEFEWPHSAMVESWVAESAVLVQSWESLYHTVEPLQVAGPPPYLVTGAAANASRGKYAGDAGIDLAIDHAVEIDPGGYLLVSTGVFGAIPDGYFGLITGRSSTWARYRCDVRTAVIDHGYRGELMLGIENRGTETARFEAGQRLGQIVLLPVFGGALQTVDELPPAERGTNGYGSSDEPPTEVIPAVSDAS